MWAGAVLSICGWWQSLPHTLSTFRGTNSAPITLIGVLLTLLRRSTWHCLGLFHTTGFFSTIRFDLETGFIVACSQDPKETSPLSSSSVHCIDAAVTSSFPHTHTLQFCLKLLLAAHHLAVLAHGQEEHHLSATSGAAILPSPREPRGSSSEGQSCCCDRRNLGWGREVPWLLLVLVVIIKRNLVKFEEPMS